MSATHVAVDIVTMYEQQIKDRTLSYEKPIHQNMSRDDDQNDVNEMVTYDFRFLSVSRFLKINNFIG